MRRKGRRRIFLCAIWGIGAFFLCVSFQEEAMADLSGYADLTYIHSKTKEETPDGQVTNSKGDTFQQRYSLTLTRNLYPNLGLTLGGLFENDLFNTTVNGVSGKVTTRSIRPLVELSLRTPPYFADLFYTRREDTFNTSGAAAVTDVIETYKASFNWNSTKYPTGRLDITRTNLFDKTRTISDTTTDLYSLKLDYVPTRGVTFRSRTEYEDSNNRIAGVDTTLFTQTTTIGYDASFFKNRVAVSVNYELNLSKVDSRSGSGELLVQVFPIAGLSAIDNSPSNGALDVNQALIDGEKAVGAGINIGLPPSGGNANPRNIGLDFFQQQKVDTFHIWIDREIPHEIANFFRWDLYTSADNLNWIFVRTIAPAAFDTSQNFFEIQFPPVTARYFKVVVEPLSLAVPRAPEFPTILVTEMQAFLRQSHQGKESLTSTTHNLNASGKVILLERPLIFYDTSYALLVANSKTSSTRWSLTNGLNIVHAFNRVFSGQARVSREDNSDPTNGTSEIYRSSVSVTAVPVKKLSHNLVVSGSYEKNPQGTIRSRQFFLDNTAGLYRGLDVFLNGGLGTTTDEKGIKRDSKILNAGAQIVPHPTLTVNLNYFYNETKPDEITQEVGKVFSRTVEIDFTFTPVRSTSLAFSLSRVKQESRSETLKNLSVNWSPFAGGALVFSFNYSEELRKSDNNLFTTIRPFVRWNITNKMYLEVSYLKTKSDGDTGKVISDFVTTHFNVRF